MRDRIRANRGGKRRDNDIPINPYAGPPPVASDPDDLSDEDRKSEIILARLFDNAGEDAAFEMGLSPVFRPAPAGGRLDANPEDLVP